LSTFNLTRTKVNIQTFILYTINLLWFQPNITCASPVQILQVIRYILLLVTKGVREEKEGEGEEDGDNEVVITKFVFPQQIAATLILMFAHDAANRTCDLH